MKEYGSSERAVAELVVHLGRIACGDGFISGLTAVQWTTLRYFSRANRFSRTVSAFAEFHSTTRGTASQTIKGLVAEGYLKRARSEADRRSTRLDLTKKARAILADDPIEALVRAAGALPFGRRNVLARNLEHMLDYVARERDRRRFGMCPSCAHLEWENEYAGGRQDHECGLMRQRLETLELGQICVNFEPRTVSTMQRTMGREAAR